MIKVAIDPDVGKEAVVDARSNLSALSLRCLAERCLLVSESAEAAAQLLRSFSESPLELKGLVQQLLQHRMLVPYPEAPPTPISELEATEDLESWRSSADLLLLGAARDEYLREFSVAVSPEHVGVRDFMNAAVVERTYAAWDRSVKSGEARESVWRERFDLLSRFTDTVYITDAWAIGEVARELKYPSGRRSICGSMWFLAHLARSRVKVIHVVSSSSSLKDGIKSREAVGLVETWFGGQAPKKQIHLHLSSREFDHGRRVAFDGWVAFDIHKGLSSFDRDPIREGFGLNASADLLPEAIKGFRRLAAGATDL